MTKKTLTVKESYPIADEMAEALGLPSISGSWWMLLCEDSSGNRLTLAGDGAVLDQLQSGPQEGSSVTCGGAFPFFAVGWQANGWARLRGPSMTDPARRLGRGAWHEAFSSASAQA